MQTLLQSNSESVRVDSLTTYQEQNRIVVIIGKITDEQAIRVRSELDYFYQQSPTDPIYLEIQSPGGSVSAGYSILDYCEMLPNEIITIGTGTVASMGSFLLSCAGDKRYVTKNCDILYHQPLVDGLSGQASDIEIHTLHLLKTKDNIINELSKHSHLSKKKLKALLDRDSWLEPEECVKLGLIDGVLETLPFHH